MTDPPYVGALECDLPRPPDRNERHRICLGMGDAAAIKHEIRKSDEFVHIEEFGRMPKKVKAELTTGELPHLEDFHEWGY